MAKQIEGMYVGGGWTSTARTFPDYNPSDGSVWANVPDAGVAETRAAIEAAHEAFPAWAAMPFNQRSALMLKAGHIFESRRDQIVEAIMNEGGGWFGKAMFETGYTAEIFPAAAAANYGAIGEVLPSEHGKLSLAMRRPMGVVAVISPWNFPLILSTRGFAFPLVAGNTIVLKPSEDTPYLGGLLFAEIFEEAGFPKGVFNVVTCSRSSVAAVGDELIENPLVKGVSFTGSTAVGRVVAAKAGAHLKKFCVELGGKNSMIVCDDADLERATQAANFGSFMHQGQICMSIERIIVNDKIYDKFVDQFLPRVKKLKVGSTADKANVLGPVINDRAAQRLKRHFEDARAKGAKIATGGERVGSVGNFFAPTVLTDVSLEADVFNNEPFGPVAAIRGFDTLEEAIAEANRLPFGLAGYAFTKSIKNAHLLSQQMEVGMLWINQPAAPTPEMPFGGIKDSGYGSEGGPEAMEAYLNTKAVSIMAV